MRNNRSVKSKATAPVPLPHDGPIFHRLQQRRRKDDPRPPLEDSDPNDPAEIKLALQLVVGRETAREEDHPLRKEDHVAFLVVQTLQSASNIKDQLQAIQGFKSTLLNLKIKDQPIHGSTANAMYQLFLEWSLSCNTTLPLQRALHSCLQALETTDGTSNVILERTLNALLTTTPSQLQSDYCCWRDPLHFLDVAVNTPFICAVLKDKMLENVLFFMYHRWVESMIMKRPQEEDDEEWVSRGLLLCKLVKILLQPQSENSDPTLPSSCGIVIPFCDELEALVVRLMNCPTLPIEGFSTLGIVFARLHLNARGDAVLSQPDLAQKAIQSIQNLTSTSSRSSVDHDEAVVHSSLARLSIVQGISATLDAKVLLSAASSHGTRTPLEECWRYLLHVGQVAADPVARWAALKGLSTLATRWKQHSEDASPEQTVVFEGLIQDTLDVILQAWENPPLRKLGTAIPGIFQALLEFLSDLQRQKLCQRVLDQPVSRKGRFLAVEILLPYISSSARIVLLQTESLIERVGDHGPNAGVIANLWIKLLAHAWEHSEHCFDEWVTFWLVPLSQSLVEGDLGRRKQVLAFCVVRLLELIKRDMAMNEEVMSRSVAILFDAISESKNAGPVVLSSNETCNDRILWAHLELARVVRQQKFLNQETKASIAGHVTIGRLYTALGHHISFLRISAFLALETIVTDVYGLGLEEEAKAWKIFMPIVMNASESIEHTSIILQCMFSFLDRLSVQEASIALRSNAVPHMELPTFNFFVNDFVIGVLILKQGLYPGTVSTKEEFALHLLESLIAFVLQNQAYAADGSARNGTVFLRQRAQIEMVEMRRILECLLQQEIFASLFSLLYTQWDKTRASAFRVLTKLVLAAQESDLNLPEVYYGDGRIQLESRGVYLASSPRQREAETGSQLLAFVYISMKSVEERNEFLMRIFNCLERRLSEMQSSLETILLGDDDATVLQEGKRLPLSHGIIHAILLVVRYHDIASRTSTCIDAVCHGLIVNYEQVMSIFCGAIEMSLKIIADTHDGESIEGLGDATSINEEATGAKGSGTPLNVNTGAIGANGTVARLSHKDQDDRGRRLATQRIVVGTWLLIKETCAAASAVISSQALAPSPSSVLNVGTLLISTMTSLKHAGAAFAARDSLQDIASTCLRSRDPELKAIPGSWTARLMKEMCSNRTVRDSTLRRSTGYALGFQAMMRSDFATKVNGSELCNEIMKRLIAYSLPTETELKKTIVSLDCLHDTQQVSTLFSCGNDSDSIFIPDTAYDARCRVHALNVLRMLVLDATLSPAVVPFIGDSIISSLLGYNDPSWAVRNSATMVFSAAMLRVVDADKNGSNTDKTSNQAITMTELFRRYPPLAAFLPSMMKNYIVLQENQANSQLFPILLLISRIQSAGMCATTQSYPDLIFKALENKHHAVRAAAARALANLCTNLSEIPSSTATILRRCIGVVNDGSKGVNENWNLIEGALMVLERIVMSTHFMGLERGIIAHDLESALMTVVQQHQTSFPPPCIATALNVLTRLAITTPCRSSLLTICASLASDGRYEMVPGGPLLYTSATASINEFTRDVWYSCDERSVDQKLQQLRLIFSSESIDVRIASVKTFKKAIYENIDGALAKKNSSIPTEVNLLKVASMILDCTEAEIRRGKPHIPTVRRLSRCFLEIYDGYRTLEGCEVETFAVATQTRSHILWDTANAMIKNENFLSDSGIRPHGETFLAGNAAELMAIQIAVDVRGQILAEDRVSVFTRTVCRLNNLHASWISRYSAAKAMVTSRLLASSHNGMPLNRNVLLLEILKMLQDSDPDVQRCATLAAAHIESLRMSEENDGVVRSSLPSQTLRRLFAAANGLSSDDDIHSVDRARALLQIISNNTSGLSDGIDSLIMELDHSREFGNPWKISNSSEDREIFEEEDPNSSDERLLSSQLAILALLNCHMSQSIVNGLAPCHTYIVEMLRKTLESLVKRNSRGGIVHDMSRFPSIFSSLHALLGAVAALIYSGICTTKDTKEVVLLSEGLLRSSAVLHPEISSALSCLRTATCADSATKTMVRHLLFLL